VLRLVISRFLWAIPVLWLVATVTFFLMHAAPGGPWDAKSGGGRTLDPALAASFERKYGLDEPLWQQYARYLGNAARFDFGTSFTQEGTDVSTIVLRGFPESATIGVLAFAISLAIGLPIGVLAALKQNTLVDYVSLLIATIGYTLPSFVVAIFFLVIFAVKLEWVPVLFDGGKSYILPALVLGISGSAFLARLMRSSTLEVMRQDHVRTARAKGLRARMVTTRHIVRNGMIPVITVLGPTLAALITGTIIIERVFGIPGMGYLFIDSITRRDYPVIMGTTIFYAFIVVLGNLLVDIAYIFADPRIRSQQ
jgi:oligopeptide transport system permease protein